MAALGFVGMAGSVSTDLYLPAFPGIAADFGVSATAVQFTLTAFLIGAACGQLLIGAMSDAVGRRRTLLIALTAFAVCGYVAALSPTFGMLVAVRALQGFAGAAGAVLARAVISDLADRDAALRGFSALWAMTALGPAIASPLGALLATAGGWRAALTGLAVVATAMLISSALLIPESLPAERRHPLSFAPLARNVGGLVRVPAYVALTLAFAAGYASLMVYISSSSFIVQGVFGAGPGGYALTFTYSSLVIMAGAWASGRAATRLGALRVLRGAQALAVLAASVAAGLALTGVLGFVSYLVLVGCFALGCGGILSCASALALGRAPHARGAASALLGFTQFALGAAASPLGGLMGAGSAVPATVAMSVLATTGLVAGVTFRRSGE
ncbi:Bcr/CflA family efflux MFS transporter [Microbacterium tenebrionis]|uniref:Bcr/CflA family efflux MFS transporter n=1 Tax=Microbacterium tenebrionis TaxID=2830665 RepID=UPI002545E503|nr:Bcr/CflA family efflux MFS transporter [Microbacterium ihumii]